MSDFGVLETAEFAVFTTLFLVSVVFTHFLVLDKIISGVLFF